jgi:hypothetical protein
MRQILLLLVPLALSACNTTSLWEKAGTDQAAMSLDLGKCRHEALQEAARTYATERRYPFYEQPFFIGGLTETSWRLRRAVENDQGYAEKALAAGCMRRKGYQPTPA